MKKTSKDVKGEGVARSSKLKRRRMKEDDASSIGNITATCDLQHLGGHHDDLRVDAITVSERRRSEKSALNTNPPEICGIDPSLPKSSSPGNPLNNKIEKGRETLKKTTGDTVELSRNSYIAHITHSGSQLNQNEKDSPSFLTFVDSMDHSDLVSSIPRIVGVDLRKYGASSSAFKHDLEHAFSRKVESLNAPKKEIYHSLVGKIQPSSGREENDVACDSLSFPQSNRWCNNETIRCGNPGNDLFMKNFLNPKRRTGDGIHIPLSVCQFPSTKKASPSSSDNNIKITDQNNGGAKSFITKVEQPTSASIDPSPPLAKFKGKIHIVSDIGATIRDIFDIDESKHVLGKLHHGDVRYFLEKKVLPAPPISVVKACDGDDDCISIEEEDECVAVVRYKVFLKPGDCNGSIHFAKKDISGQMTGWVSDRGRLADDPYLILKEI